VILRVKKMHVKLHFYIIFLHYIFTNAGAVCPIVLVVLRSCTRLK